ncbi:MAG: HypC/HybG/HupF family hydrogenase formation chaperone [Candidatus Arsenophonus phytopathogenicus]
MCIGIPGKISQITDSMLARVAIGGVIRDVDLTLVGKYDENGNSRLGQWVLVHVGFAMNVIDEHAALDTLAALQNMYDLEPDVGILLYGEEKR